MAITIHEALRWASSFLQENDECASGESAKVGDNAGDNHQEPSAKEYDTLQKVHIRCKMANQRRRQRDHADHCRDESYYKIEGRRVNHQDDRRQHENVRDDERCNRKL